MRTRAIRLRFFVPRPKFKSYAEFQDRCGAPAAAVVLNILAWNRKPPLPLTIATPDALRLSCEPAADCKRYDSLRGHPSMDRSQVLDTMAQLKLNGTKAASDEIITTAVKRQHEPQ